MQLHGLQVSDSTHRLFTAHGLRCTRQRVAIYDARFAKPVDGQLIERLLGAGTPIVTIEDHGIHGGFGTAVIEEASERGLNAGLVTRMALPDS